MVPDIALALAQARRGYVTAAAGCGKTEAIAIAVTSGEGGRQRILTHTHAGVRALRQRLAQHKAARSRYHVDTIAGWALSYAVHYPQLSGLTNPQPTGEAWASVYEAARHALGSAAVRRVVTTSYAGVYVDEYQDCTLGQHRLVLMLADLLPCRVLGDPLQGIFGFRDEEPIDWTANVEACFERLPELLHPWRWENANAALGRRLQEVRLALLAGEDIDLRIPPVSWRPLSPEEASRACLAAAREPGSVVVIRKWPQACHSLAKTLKGRFTSMEEMDSQDLHKWAGRIEQADGPERALRLIEFAMECMTAVGTELGAVRSRLAEGTLPKVTRLRKHQGVAQALVDVAGSSSFRPVVSALQAVEGIRHVLYRRELWREMGRALQLQTRSTGMPLRDAAWKARDRTRHAGRMVEQRTVSRTLLVKGLEFDHAVVLNASEHDAKNFYVAITRGSRSLTVLSKDPVIRPKMPGND